MLQNFEFARMGRPRDQKLLNEIASRIKKLREKQNITLEEFYNDTGIHLARIESSKGNVTVSTLKAICNYFNISLQEFFRGL